MYTVSREKREEKEMDKKTTGIISYITWIGWIISFCAGDKKGAKFHLNQSLVIFIVQIVSGIASFILGFIPIINIITGIVFTIFGIFMFVCWIMGLVFAIQGVEKEVPLVGKIRILK